MALIKIGVIAAITDAVAATLVSGATATRSAVDARVRVGTADAVADAIANNSTVIDAAAAAAESAAAHAVSGAVEAAVDRATDWAGPVAGVWDLPDDSGAGRLLAITDGTGRVGAGIHDDGTWSLGETELHVIVGAGQSNMVGRGGPYGAPLDTRHRRLWAWHARSKRLHHTAGRVEGPDYFVGDQLSPLWEFGRRYAESHPDAIVLVVPTAVGGTGFAGAGRQNWDSTKTDNLYTDMLATVAEAMTAAQQLGTPSIQAVLWHQGEFDASRMDGATYSTHLRTLVTNLRGQWGNVPFIAGELNVDSLTAGEEAVMRATANLSLTHDQTGFVHVGPNLSRRADDTTHFSRAGTQALGKAMFDAFEPIYMATVDSDPVPPIHVEAVQSVGVTTIRWSMPHCRPKAYLVEGSRDGTTWTTIASSGAWRETTTTAQYTYVRVSTVGMSATSLPSAPVTVAATALNTVGWRDITALLDSSVVPSSAGVHVRRIDDRIEYRVLGITVSGMGIALPWGTLPVGYRPTGTQYAQLGYSSQARVEAAVNYGGGLVLAGGTAGTYRGNFTVWTDAAAPTTHPGTAVA